MTLTNFLEDCQCLPWFEPVINVLISIHVIRRDNEFSLLRNSSGNVSGFNVYINHALLPLDLKFLFGLGKTVSIRPSTDCKMVISIYG